LSLHASALAQNPAPVAAPSGDTITAPATTSAAAPEGTGPSTTPTTTGASTKPATPTPIRIGNYTVSGSVRARYENWSWFETPGFQDTYGFGGVLTRVGIGRNTPKLDVLAELAIPALISLPDNANAPAPRGALGLGANYRAANGGQDGSIFPSRRSRG
jgi:hypothetical protein